MAKTTRTATKHRTGIYVDVQNFQEIARELLCILISRWLDVMPEPSTLNLYVRADHQQLWRVWATYQFSDLEVTVKGVQHYSLAATKNAADMAIAVDAISDLLHERISHVAVVSDDSDFIALFAKLAEEIEEGRTLYKGRVAPEMVAKNFYDRALVDILVKSKGHIESVLW